jgi:hypothetical protein
VTPDGNLPFSMGKTPSNMAFERNRSSTILATCNKACTLLDRELMQVQRSLDVTGKQEGACIVNEVIFELLKDVCHFV